VGTVKVVVRLNPQQERLLAELVAERILGATSIPELIARAFDEFCSTHPELLDSDGKNDPQRA
jgi:hypothetical protein